MQGGSQGLQSLSPRLTARRPTPRQNVCRLYKISTIRHGCGELAVQRRLGPAALPPVAKRKMARLGRGYRPNDILEARSDRHEVQADSVERRAHCLIVAAKHTEQQVFGADVALPRVRASWWAWVTLVRSERLSTSNTTRYPRGALAAPTLRPRFIITASRTVAQRPRGPLFPFRRHTAR